MTDPYQVTRDFEKALCEYTGAKYAVAVNSCSAALLLSTRWLSQLTLPVDWLYQDIPPWTIEIPRRTYVSVPCSIKQAGCSISWRDEKWKGMYQLKPLPVWDCARRFTSSMYVPSQFQCISFAAAKILGIEQGGAILHDNDEADPWFRRMRFDGRTEGVDQREDNFREIGYHCIMLPSIAAQALLRLHHLPKDNPDMPDFDYPDLSKFDVFR